MTLLQEQMQTLARLAQEQVRAVHQVGMEAGEIEARLTEEQQRAAQLENQIESLREEALSAANEAASTIGNLDARLVDEQKRSRQLEEQLRIVRAEAIEAVNQAAARIGQLEAKLGEEENRCIQLSERIGQLEPIAACVDKFSQALGEISRFSNKSVAA
jgi:chromosome segregation ATPase